MYKIQFFTKSYTPNRWMDNNTNILSEEQAWVALAKQTFEYSQYRFRIVDESGNVITQ